MTTEVPKVRMLYRSEGPRGGHPISVAQFEAALEALGLEGPIPIAVVIKDGTVSVERLSYLDAPDGTLVAVIDTYNHRVLPEVTDAEDKKSTE